MKVPLASSGLRSCDIDEAIATLQSGHLTMGQKVKLFEQKMSDYLGTKHFIMMNSGSSANLAIIESLVRSSKGTPLLSMGDGVLVPAVAWPTTIWPLIQLGLTPIFVDVDLKTLALDLDEAQKIIDASQVKVRAIFPIHPLGYPIDHTVLENFSKKNSLILINDVCESLGSFKGDTHGGVCGLASSFSFYFSHHITTMEGGGVATNEDYLADELRSIRSHGWSRDRSDVASWTNNLSGNDSKFLFVSTGFNIRPMEIQAAIGIKQIEAIDSFIERRISIAAEIFEAVQGTSLRLIGGEYVNNPDTDVKHSWMMMPLIFEGNGAIEKRGIAVEMLEELGIETRPVLTGNFLAQPSIRNLGHDFPEPENFPNASQISKAAFMVGCHHDFTDAQVTYLAESLKKIASQLS